MVTRGVDGLAKLGGMGPQIASLIRHSEDEIKVRRHCRLNICYCTTAGDLNSTALTDCLDWPSLELK